MLRLVLKLAIRPTSVVTLQVSSVQCSPACSSTQGKGQYEGSNSFDHTVLLTLPAAAYSVSSYVHARALIVAKASNSRIQQGPQSVMHESRSSSIQTLRLAHGCVFGTRMHPCMDKASAIVYT